MAAADTPSAVITVLLQGGETVFHCRVDQTILEAAIDAGLDVPFFCREGHCGTCVAKLISGTVESRTSAGLSRRDRKEGLVLACQSRPSSANLRLSYDG